MAQLNPNFEIDFSDINSYEQIQLINDTQLAKENLLMHRAYKEPSDDEIIRNQFSSFTFVDFCPKLFGVKPSSIAAAYRHHDPQNATTRLSTESSNRLSMKCYELETFSDLFERINTWLKLNKDWRVVSMETLIYDCTSQFNHQKSSIYSNYLPQNTRGLRLFLSPSKSRFSGPQKIGCINVVPRKVSGSYMKPEDPPTYETLDEILNRLNELLLTRPIEGRILSVETLTLPMVNGYVNTESNYFIDSRLNSLYDETYFVGTADCVHRGDQSQQQPPLAEANTIPREQSLIDILRVYYEFGPLVCGLVNLIDFVPRFYSSSSSAKPQLIEQTATADGSVSDYNNPADAHEHQSTSENPMPKPVPKIAATESLTRLIRRSLAWFELERKRILKEKTCDAEESSDGVFPRNRVFDLKVCNLQVHHKTLLKNQLLQVNAANAIETANTRMMVHERMADRPPVVCGQCCMSSASVQVQDWCSHLIELTQPYNLKFVRLAYIVPVFSTCALRPSRPLRLQRPAYNSQKQKQATADESTASTLAVPTPSDGTGQQILDLSSSSTDSSEPATPNPEPQEPGTTTGSENNEAGDEQYSEQHKLAVAELLKNAREEEDAKQLAIAILRDTDERHMTDEQAHQMQQVDDGLNDSPIGQLTYRLFAPCQLVNSSSCFAINPVNSSSPLARRGSMAAVDMNGSGISSENAHPSTSLLAPGSSNSLSSVGEPQQIVTSFGAFFPALSHEVSTTASHSDSGGGGGGGGGGSTMAQPAGGGGNASRFTTNEFEPVDAIKRRMEVYVTTNSMKVIAGETLIVHLSDALSCLSTAIEKTVVMANCSPKRTHNTWVSVYVLYAAVDEPQLPAQLLAQQKMRDLCLIDEGSLETEETEEDLLARVANKIFDNDFKGSLNSTATELKKHTTTSTVNAAYQSSDQPSLSHAAASTSAQHASGSPPSLGAIRVEQNPVSSSLTLYNSAYDRTVALPTPPENHLCQHTIDPADFMGADGVWLEEDPFSDKILHMPDMADRKKRLKKAKKRSRHDESQCSII